MTESPHPRPLFQKERGGSKFHAEPPRGIHDHFEELPLPPFICGDFPDRVSAISRERERLWPSGHPVQQFVQIINELIDIFIGEPVRSAPVRQQLVLAPCARETVQPVLREHALRLGNQGDDLEDGHILAYGNGRVPLFHTEKIPYTVLPVRHFSNDSSVMFRTLFLRIATGALLLLVGWQLGVNHERSGRMVHLRNGAESARSIRPGLSASGVTVSNPRRDVDISLLWNVWEELNDQYIDPKQLQVTPLVYGAAEGLTRAVGDAYTVFMTPKENDDFRKGLAGNLEGIGAELTARDGAIVIVTPLKGSPAERVGLRSKDVIQEVNGESIDTWSLTQVVDRIRGPKGTSVRIGIYREASSHSADSTRSPQAGSAGGKREFTIVREQIHIPSVESHLIQTENVMLGYIALNQFGEDSIGEFKKELQALKDKRAQGVILDLRNNGGGYLDGAVDLVSLFVREGTVVGVENRAGRGKSQDVSGKVLLPNTPLVVLQNEATASASEIVSGALQDHGRATIVGKKSFGKGTVQEVVDLPGGSSLRVTVARWLTPKGKNLGKEGVQPDVEVEPRPEEEKPPDVGTPWDWQADPQLAKGVELLLKK